MLLLLPQVLNSLYKGDTFYMVKLITVMSYNNYCVFSPPMYIPIDSKNLKSINVQNRDDGTRHAFRQFHHHTLIDLPHHQLEQGLIDSLK